MRVCRQCGKEYQQNGAISKTFCSADCHHHYYYTTKTCATCGKQFISRKRSVTKNCSRQCGDKWRAAVLRTIWANKGGTRHQVIEMRKNNICATGSEIAVKYGVSRGRVRQILASEQLPTKHYIQKYHCLECGEPFVKNKLYRSKLFCSKECKHNYHYPLVTCVQCGKSFRRRASAMAIIRVSNRFFCDKHCQGKFVGEHYGRGKNVSRVY